MKRNPYEKFKDKELILRDQLAIDRTVLSNERTLLAYCRTALALVVTGAGLIQILEALVAKFAGWLMIACGLVVITIGMCRTSRMRRKIRAVQLYDDDDQQASS